VKKGETQAGDCPAKIPKKMIILDRNSPVRFYKPMIKAAANKVSRAHGRARTAA
jgi:hypothetical protein